MEPTMLPTTGDDEQDSDDVSDAKIELAAWGIAPLKIDELTGDEQERFLDGLAERERQRPTIAQEAYWEERRQRGVGVGMDEEGNLVYGLPGGRECRGEYVGDDDIARPKD
jgi:hypothetical protein